MSLKQTAHVALGHVSAVVQATVLSFQARRAAQMVLASLWRTMWTMEPRSTVVGGHVFHRLASLWAAGPRTGYCV